MTGGVFEPDTRLDGSSDRWRTAAIRPWFGSRRRPCSGPSLPCLRFRFRLHQRHCALIDRRAAPAQRICLLRLRISLEIDAAYKETWFAASKLPRPFPTTLDPAERRFLLFEPIPVWQRVRVPILAIWGSEDTFLPAHDSDDLIAAALRVAGNARTALHVLPGLSHNLYETRAPGVPWDVPRSDPTLRAASLWLDPGQAAAATWLGGHDSAAS